MVLFLHWQPDNRDGVVLKNNIYNRNNCHILDIDNFNEGG